MTTALLIDDDPELGELLTKYLGAEGIQLHAAPSAAEGLQRFRSGGYDLVILDIMLPDTSGFEVLGRLRAESNIPIIMLTGRGEEIDRVVGLEKGADDYIPKPFPLRELLARMRAVLRRFSHAGAAAAETPARQRAAVRIGELSLDPGARQATLAGTPLPLTATEFSILDLLSASPGNIVEREVLMEKALGKGVDFDDYVLNVHMSNLRKKLAGRVSIKTIRGRGYLMAVTQNQEA
jgi:DNA-binding response OmpR family regulator